MSDPRFDRDPDRRLYANRESTAGSGSVWVAGFVAILVIAGVAAYSYRCVQTASNPPRTTSGQSTREPLSPLVASTPPVSKAPTTPAWRVRAAYAVS
jgi:hypothetical protein